MFFPLEPYFPPRNAGERLEKVPLVAVMREVADKAGQKMSVGTRHR